MIPTRMLLSVGALLLAGPLAAADKPRAVKVERQPLEAQVKRVVQALDLLGAPLPTADRAALKKAYDEKDDARAVATIQEVLDKHCLAGVRITAAGKGPPVLKTRKMGARPELAEQGWRVFLVKVENAAGKEGVELRAESPSALPLFQRSTGKPDPKVVSVGEVGKRFLDLQMLNSQPLVPDLSGLELEYRILQVYCRDSGRKEAALGFGLWREVERKDPQGVVHRVREPVAHGDRVTFDLESAPAVLVKLRVRDHDGTPVMGAF